MILLIHSVFSNHFYPTCAVVLLLKILMKFQLSENLQYTYFATVSAINEQPELLDQGEYLCQILILLNICVMILSDLFGCVQFFQDSIYIIRYLIV